MPVPVKAFRCYETMAWKHFRLSWFPFRERSCPQWCGHRGSKPTSGDGDTTTSPHFFTESQNTVGVFHVKHSLKYLSFSVLVGAIDVPQKNRFGRYIHVDGKTGGLAWAGESVEHGCSALRSHLYSTGGTGQCLEFQGCSHGFPREKGVWLLVWIF